MTDVLDHWVDGAPCAGTGTRTGDVYDPAKGTVQKQVRFGSAADVDAYLLERAQFFFADFLPFLRQLQVVD